MFDPVTALTVFAPVLQDGFRAIFNKITGGAGAKPQNVDEVIKIQNSENERLRVIAEMDKPSGQVHVWVNDVRALQRPFAVLAVWVAFAIGIYMPAPVETMVMLANMTSMTTFYLFGDRTYSYFKNEWLKK